MYQNKIVVHAPGALFAKKLGMALVFGIFLIPIALIMKLLRIR
jgi:hypothetical protein